MNTEIFGYVASFLIGVSLGFIGAGGSILTVPVMVYVFHVPVLEASSYSLFIIGVTSSIGTCLQLKEDNVNWKLAVSFGLVSLPIIFLIRHEVLPEIPSRLASVYGVPLTSSMLSMLLFSLLMFTTARTMISKKQVEETEAQPHRSIPRTLFCSVLVGLVTGFLGVGGGFILIPSLVLLLGLPIKKAIGTSLLIIAFNSLFGFALDIGHTAMDWRLLGLVTLIVGGGVLLGVTVGRKISSAKLKVTFGWMVMIVGVAVLVKEVIAFVARI